MTNAHLRLATDATGQLGVFTRAQAHVAGLSDDQLRRRVQSGILEVVGPHAFRSPLSPRSALGDLAALLIDIGKPSAAALHGFDGFRLKKPFHLMLLRDRNVRRMGAIIHTTSELPLIDRGHAQGLDVLSGARTVIDVARHFDGPAMARAIESGLRDGLFNEDLLHRRIVALRSRGRFGLPRLLDVLADAEVTRSGHRWLERRFQQLIADAGLPRPATQQVLAKAQDRIVRVEWRGLHPLGNRARRARPTHTRPSARASELSEHVRRAANHLARRRQNSTAWAGSSGRITRWMPDHGT